MLKIRFFSRSSIDFVLNNPYIMMRVVLKRNHFMLGEFHSVISYSTSNFIFLHL